MKSAKPRLSRNACHGVRSSGATLASIEVHGVYRDHSWSFRNASYSTQRLKISEPLVPPKPKEFDNAYSASIFCGLFGT